MKATLSIQIDCGKDTCNPSIYKRCKWLLCRYGLAGEPFCGLFSGKLLGEHKDAEGGSYKEYRRHEKCKESQIGGCNESDT